MSDSDDDGSVPPDAQGEAVGADDLPQAAGANAAPQHPVWAAAAGRGGGAANKGRSDNVYGPISMMELEIRGRGDLDGGSSTASVRGGDAKKKDAHSRHGKKAKNGKRPREYDDDDDSDDSDNEAGSSASLDMAGAAFGGATTKNRAACASEASDDGVSVTSSVVRRRHERAFPITGVTCVGCALPAKIQPVTEFISKNMSTMSELALYKMAALVYKTKVAEPAEEEGVDVPVGRPFENCNNSKPYTPTDTRAAHATGLGLEGGACALPAAHGRLAHAALREHPHALGHAQDARDAAAAPRRRDGRADARQEQRRVHHEDHRRQQPRADATGRREHDQEARMSTLVSGVSVVGSTV